MEGSLGRKRHVDYFREVHLEDRQEGPDACLTHIEILHGWDTYDRARVDRLLAVSDSRHMENGIVIHRRVKTRVITKGPLRTRLSGLHISLDHEITLGRHLQRLGHAFHEIDRLLTGESGKENLVNAVRERCRSSQSEGRITPEADGDRHLLAALVVALPMAGSDLVDLPMHPGSLTIVDLDAVHADITLPGIGIFCINRRQGDEPAAILRPALQDR